MTALDMRYNHAKPVSRWQVIIYFITARVGDKDMNMSYATH